MTKATNLRALLRYNSGIVWGHTPWLIVIPVAAAMLVLFWNMAIASMFTPSRAAQTTEGLAPILAALLSAHLLGVEYRHRIGEITFSKPFAARRILYLRLIALYVLVAVLVAVMLFVYVQGIGKPFPVAGVILAGIPSVLFLSMLSLLTATLFRQAAAGLAVAGLYWAADLYGGVELHPLLSLQGYGAALRQEEMAAWWLQGKLLLLALSVVFYIISLRLVGRPEGIRTRARSVRNVGILAAVALLYLYTGAAAKAAYGLRHEQEWPNRARLWYQDRFRVYGALPVARLLGRDLPDYLGARAQQPDTAGGVPSPTEAASDSTRLRRVIERSPRGRWTDHALYTLARSLQVQTGNDPALAEAKTLFDRLVQEHSRSAFAPPALWNLQRMATDAGDTAAVEDACRRLVERYPASHEAPPAAQILARGLWEQGRHEEAALLLDRTAAKAEPADAAALLQIAGGLYAEMGRPADARDRYARALSLLDPLIAALSQTIADHEDTPTSVMEERNKLERRRREVLEARQALAP